MAMAKKIPSSYRGRAKPPTKGLQDTALTPDKNRSPTVGDILPLEAPGPGSDMTRLFANKYTNEDSMLWQ